MGKEKERYFFDNTIIFNIIKYKIIQLNYYRMSFLSIVVLCKFIKFKVEVGLLQLESNFVLQSNLQLFEI